MFDVDLVSLFKSFYEKVGIKIAYSNPYKIPKRGYLKWPKIISGEYSGGRD
jgi:hypothetical protein